MGFQKKECRVREEKERTEGFGFGASLAWATASLLSNPPVNQIMFRPYSTFQWLPGKLRMNPNSLLSKGNTYLASLVSYTSPLLTWACYHF